MSNPIAIECQNCGLRLRVTDKFAGKRVKCKECGSPISVPAATQSETIDQAPQRKPREPATRPQRRAARSDQEPAGDRGERDRSRRQPRTSRSAKPARQRPRAATAEDDWADDWGDLSSEGQAYAENPYAAPASSSAPGPAVAQPSGPFAVEGKEIRCGKSVHLPQICVRTGATSGLTQVQKTLKHSPVWAYMVGGVILALIMQRSCNVTYYIGADAKKRQNLFLGIGVGGVILGILCFLGAGIGDLAVLALFGFLLLIGGFVFCALGAAPVKISRRNGDSVFWLKGFKPPFLQRVGQMAGGR